MTSLTEDKLSRDIEKRLARLAGHATSLRKLWQEGIDPDEMLVQVSAVRAALDQVGKVILQHHVDRCVRDAVTSGQSDEAIKDLQKSLDRFI